MYDVTSFHISGKYINSKRILLKYDNECTNFTLHPTNTIELELP